MNETEERSMETEEIEIPLEVASEQLELEMNGMKSTNVEEKGQVVVEQLLTSEHRVSKTVSPLRDATVTIEKQHDSGVVDQIEMSENEAFSDDLEDTDMPQLVRMNLVSSSEVPAAAVKELPYWAHFFVQDRADRATWRLPYRDNRGYINKHLLSSARHQLTSGKLKAVRKSSSKRDESKAKLIVKINQGLRSFINKMFRIAWPGLPEVQIKSELAMNTAEQASFSQDYGCQSVFADAEELQHETRDILNDVFTEDEDSLGLDEMQGTEVELEEERLKQIERHQALVEEQERSEVEDRERRGQALLTRLKQLRRAPSKKPESKPVYVKRILDDAGMSRKAVHIDDVEVLEHMDIKGKDDILITFDSQELEHDSIEDSGAFEDDILQRKPGVDTRAALRSALLKKSMKRAADEKAMKQGYKSFDHQVRALRKRQVSSIEELDEEEALLEEVGEVEVADERQSQLQLDQGAVDDEEVCSMSESQEDEVGSCPRAMDIDERDLPLTIEKMDDDEASVSQAGEGQLDEKCLASTTTSSANAGQDLNTITASEVSGASVLEQEASMTVECSVNPAPNPKKTEQPPSSTLDESNKVSQVHPFFKKVTAEDPAAKDGCSSTEKEESSSDPPAEKSGNEHYRRLLAQENKIARAKLKHRGQNMFEDEASEEEEDDDFYVGNYGDQFKASGNDSKDKLLETDLLNQRIRDEDLEGIVDEVQEEDDALERNEQYHRDLVNEKEENELQELYQDIKENRIGLKKGNRFSRNSRVNEYLDDGSDSDSSDEEMELARQVRYDNLDEQRRALAARSRRNATKDRITETKPIGETVEEIDEEVQQQQEFLEFVKAQKAKARSLRRLRTEEGAEERRKTVLQTITTEEEELTTILTRVTTLSSYTSIDENVPNPLKQRTTLQRQVSLSMAPSTTNTATLDRGFQVKNITTGYIYTAKRDSQKKNIYRSGGKGKLSMPSSVRTKKTKHTSNLVRMLSC